MHGALLGVAMTLAAWTTLAGPALAQALAPGGVLRDCAQCPELVVVPPGLFLMGASAGEEESELVPPEARRRSQPITQIAIAQAFAIGRYPVTRGEFAAFVAATGHRAEGGCFTLSYARDPPQLFEESRGWRSPGFAQTDRHPVVCVNRADAHDYAAWLTRLTGRPYRLASEAEWEHAARAGTTAARYWEATRGEACDYANVADRTFTREMGLPMHPRYFFPCADGYAETAPVGSYRPNGFGLYDMLGNVWQWVEDCRNISYDGRPVDASPWRDGDCTRGMVRGGSWYAQRWSVRAGYRGSNTPGDRDSNIGFRIARSLVP